ncbi:MAG: hypothetical protein HXX10_05910 [Rhodoplanes sp.]|uniref:hypothetical protein n=1 Tax=Rhodoplanes sp. TaxID=1968906 RepID=UPI0017DF71D8|nr:hypothetical protein [Rhodoplanes sp.]NVO13556.1 hypothetical protein [Rhodoplanes sp.]
MEFTKAVLQASAEALSASADPYEQAVGENYAFEENVGDARRDHFEGLWDGTAGVTEAANTYFFASIQGNTRGHRPSTFEPDLNAPALLPATLEPNQKIVRLERIDQLLRRDPALGYDRLADAKRDGDTETLTEFTNLFATFDGERPAFAAFKIEVENDLKEPDWLRRLVLRLGLVHHVPADGETFRFALMEYTAKDVFEQAKPKRIERPFALATVLESRDNPAFVPVPRGSSNGFTLDLAAPDPYAVAVREVLHTRLDYSNRHVLRFGALSGPIPVPDILDVREQHLAALRSTTGRTNFGERRTADVDG